MFGTILRPAAHMRLDHIATVQERHLAIRLDPHLIPGVLRQDGQRGDVQAELERLGELAKTGAEREQLVARDACREVGDGEEDVVAAGVVQAEDVAVGGGRVVERCDEVLERGAGVVCELGEEDLRFFFGEGSHFGRGGEGVGELRLWNLRLFWCGVFCDIQIYVRWKQTKNLSVRKFCDKLVSSLGGEDRCFKVQHLANSGEFMYFVRSSELLSGCGRY